MEVGFIQYSMNIYFPDKCAGMPACQMQCANGFKKNEDGCDMCQCVESAPGTYHSYLQYIKRQPT